MGQTRGNWSRLPPLKQYPALRLRLLSGFASKEGGGLHHTHDQDRVENKIFSRSRRLSFLRRSAITSPHHPIAR